MLSEDSSHLHLAAFLGMAERPLSFFAVFWDFLCILVFVSALPFTLLADSLNCWCRTLGFHHRHVGTACAVIGILAHLTCVAVAACIGVFGWDKLSNQVDALLAHPSFVTVVLDDSWASILWNFFIVAFITWVNLLLCVRKLFLWFSWAFDLLVFLCIRRWLISSFGLFAALRWALQLISRRFAYS